MALPTAEIAVMGPEAAVNAVYYNKIQELPEGERDEFVADGAPSISRTSTCCGSGPSWWSTPWCNRVTCAPS